MISIILESTLSYLFTICYDYFPKVEMLKLLRVLTCKKLPCVNVACASWQTSGCFEPQGGVDTNF
ncbi:hypothetical protein BROSI_A3405 [Candidatus Brocadia sinica JPN1]|uniref:Uncharacterized protein n=1 Tax=Candidatus Brocadia sinica JPN1 TaxID=1197129 RepID=A0ABQ0K1H4_9BACT|nr:hypothetical protein BROSI_A3405 [Candidatus Brocadia sinica JPN1]GIK11879.1 MAG: hypothetical protein BroJett002_05860 [Candidatus Brocadia sinica]GJQ16765.1 MAG: hypothetical protein HBSIN01_07240 [Candidatus Brocadia sinica]